MHNYSAFSALGAQSLPLRCFTLLPLHFKLIKSLWQSRTAGFCLVFLPFVQMCRSFTTSQDDQVSFSPTSFVNVTLLTRSNTGRSDEFMWISMSYLRREQTDQIASAEPINTRTDCWTKLHSKSVYFKVVQCFLHSESCRYAFIRLLSDHLRCTGTISSHH